MLFLFGLFIDGTQQILNVYRVINLAVMPMRNLVLDMEIILYWNVWDRLFPMLHCMIERVNLVNDFICHPHPKIRFVLALINDNQLFREWAENRLMPYIEYFSVPLDTKNTGRDSKVYLYQLSFDFRKIQLVME